MKKGRIVSYWDKHLDRRLREYAERRKKYERKKQT